MPPRCRIGLRVKVWLNISGEYDGDTDDFSPDSQVHYIGDVNYYLGKPTGLFDYYASTHYTGISAAAGGHRRRYRQQQSIIVQRSGGYGFGEG